MNRIKDENSLIQKKKNHTHKLEVNSEHISEYTF